MNDLIVEKLSSANRLLTEAKTVQQAKVVIDIAYAAEIYAKRQQLGEEAIGYAHEIKTYALKKLGAMLKETDRATGGKPYQKSTRSEYEQVENTPTLAELGIDRKVAMLANQIDNLPLDKLESVAKRVETITEVRRQMARAEVKEAAALPNDKYRVIYADPPWKYSDQLLETMGSTKFHYPTMSIKELCDMPVKSIAQDDAVLFLWVTSPLLFECAPVIDAWGFKYKTSFVWDKIKQNWGHYNSPRHEFLLVCTRGSCLPDTPTLYDSVVSIERTGHSVKPDYFRDMITALYPHGKRIELFARQQTEGWEVYGNQRDLSTGTI